MKINNKLNKTLIAAAITSICAAGTLSTTANATQLAPVGVDKAQQQNDTRYIVVFKEHNYGALYDEAQKAGVSIKQARLAANTRTLANHKAKMVLDLDNINGAAVKLSAKQLKSLQNDSAIAYVEVDPVRYLIDAVSATEVPSVLAESTPYGVRQVQADQVSDANTGNRSVCIMDTGYEGNHEDLNPYTSALITGSDNDGAGNDTGNWWQPGHNHGTHVAGTIGALGNNGRGVTSVNPSGLLKIHNVKVFNNSGTWGYGSDLVRGVGQCQAAGSQVINMSLGGSASSNAERTAFQNAASAGVLSIAAAGNSGNSSLSYPASYDAVVSVAAVDSGKNKASFSQYNSQVEIAAPGVGVNSTVLNNGYSSMSGTSMASPHVAGVAALVWSHHTQCSAAQVRAAMGSTAQDLGTSGRDNSYGHGLIQAKAMHDALGNSCGGGTDPDPDPDPDPTPGELTNGVPKTGLNGASGSQASYTFAVPAGATNVSVTMSGGSGDADLHTKFGSAATLSSYDCRPYLNGNSETCSLSQAGGTHYVMLHGYAAYSGVTLTGSYTEDSDPGNPGDCAVAAWTSSKVYLTGEEASQGGFVYQANWWNQGQSPSTNSGQWDVWKQVRSCK